MTIVTKGGLFVLADGDYPSTHLRALRTIDLRGLQADFEGTLVVNHPTMQQAIAHWHKLNRDDDAWWNAIEGLNDLAETLVASNGLVGLHEDYSLAFAKWLIDNKLAEPAPSVFVEFDVSECRTGIPMGYTPTLSFHDAYVPGKEEDDDGELPF